jgi:chromosome segregation ATPase
VLEGRTAEASAAQKEIGQLQSALTAEMLAKDAATAKSKELAQLLSAETATRAAADGKVSALEKEVAVVQSKLEDARKAAEGTHALLGGESALLSEALEKACAQGITLTQERDALASEVESLERQRKELEEQLATAREQKVVTAREVQGLKPGVACLEENLQRKTLAELDVVAMTSTVANSAAAAAAENARLERQVEKLTKDALNPKPTP